MRPKAPPTGFSLPRFIARARLDLPIGKVFAADVPRQPRSPNITTETVIAMGRRFKIVRVDGNPTHVYRVEPDGTDSYYCNAEQFLQSLSRTPR